MSRQSFHGLAAAALLLTANPLPAGESPLDGAGASAWVQALRGLAEPCEDFTATTGTAEPGPPAAGWRAPSYLIATLGLMGASRDTIAVSPSCSDRFCGAGVILGFPVGGFDPARLEFRLVGAPADAQVAVGLLNYTTNQFDLFAVEVQPVQEGLLYTAADLPVRKEDYHRCGWAEIGISIELQAGTPIPVGTDAISIQDVTLGPM